MTLPTLNLPSITSPLIWLPYFNRVKKYTLNVNKECVAMVVVVVYLLLLLL